MWKQTLTLVAIILGMVWFAPTAKAAPGSFNANLVIFDDEMTNYQGFSTDWVQAFLNNQPGVLKSYTTGGKSAAQIIYETAAKYHINPQFLLANMQKESSILTRTSFGSLGQQYYLDWVMFYGWCDSCSTGSNKGFANQVEAAAWQFRRYVDQIAVNGYTTYGGWGPGITKSMQCIASDANRGLCTNGTTIQITPGNAATAALYAYTPHPGGNYSFWSIWKTFRFDLVRKYPDGSLIRAAGDPRVWLIQNGRKRWFTNSTVFTSGYSFADVISVPSDHLLLYPTGTEISYPNYSLLASPSGGIYLLSNDTKRPIKSRQAFNAAGFDWGRIIHVDWKELNKYPDGTEVTVNNAYPAGHLLQNNQTGAVYFVKDSKRYPIVCREILYSQFNHSPISAVAPAEIAKFTEGPPVGFKDGDLVTAGSTAYFISQGYKLPIADPETFNAYRFGWGNLRHVSDSCLKVHPTGPQLTVTQPVQSASQ